MKSENLSPTSKSTQSGEGRYFVLCDALERANEDIASREEVEALASEAIGEALREISGPLETEVLREALETAHERVRLACKGEPNQPAISALIVAEIPSHNGSVTPERYTMAGVGDARVYGVVGETIELIFSDPAGMSKQAKGKRSTSRKNRLGANEERLDVRTKEVEGTTYESLLALSFDAYSEMKESDWRSGQFEKGQAWMLSPGAAALAKSNGRKLSMAVALLAIGAAAAIGLSLWSKKDATSLSQATPETVQLPAPVATTTLPGGSDLTFDLEDLAPIAHIPAPLEDVELAPMTDAIDLEEQMMALGERFEQEVAAQQALITQYREELATLRETADEYEALATLMKEETARLEMMERSLFDEQDRRVAAEDQLQLASEQIAELEEALTSAHEAIASHESNMIALNHEREEEWSLWRERQEAQDAVAAELGELRIAHAQVSEELASLKGLTEELESLRAESARLAQLEESYAQLELAYDQLSAESESQALALNEGSEQFVALETALGEERTARAELQEALAQLTSEKAENERLLAAAQQRADETMARLQEVQEARLALGEQLLQLTQTHESLLQEKEYLVAKVGQLEQYQEHYAKQREVSQEREDRLQKLAANMENWKRAVSSLESARAELTEELGDIQTARTQKRASRGSTELSSVTRIHLVSPGETLEAISERYYGSAGNIDEILKANREAVREGGEVRVGTALIIP